MNYKKVQKAVTFATKAHKGQVRKYTHEPYVTHPIAVMNIVKSVPHTTEMLMAAALHDVVEDTPFTVEDIRKHFGNKVAVLVEALTHDKSDERGKLKRAERKRLDRLQDAENDEDAQTIRAADMLHNAPSMKKYDPKFWEKVKLEMTETIKVLTKADNTLLRKLKKVVLT
tara:strand:- start:7899 stop:8408 length:510 start_codon:yes stop_codon:yes gene_type:complete